MSSTPGQIAEQGLPEQRIVKIRRDYNTWVADETLEDYALRFTARSARKWSEFRVANTAFGAISFLLLEAIGASIMFNFGFVSSLWAIAAVGVVIFLTGVPISYYAAKYGVDMDLLTRGAGFGYIGSTITSLIYASFTFLFFALEATIMALALRLCFGIPLTPAYLICSLAVIPLVTHGITLISRLQAWTQPLWLLMLVLPFVFVIAKAPELVRQFPEFGGGDGSRHGFNLLMFGTASSVLMSMVTQIGEQIDFLRFLPERTRHNRKRWMAGMLVAGPGWIVMGALRLVGGGFLAFVAVRQGVPAVRALEPTEMYRVGFGYVFSSPGFALAGMGLFVVISQLKINVTNAYAGSLAWSNFFARVTHSHPGRVVWVVFNVAIALVLMELDVFHALQRVLGLYSNVAISWVGAIVADLVVNKPLGLSPKGIEFKRAYLYDINPVGVGSMMIASALSITAFSGLLGEMAQAFSSFIALITAFVSAPLIAWATAGRYYLARQPESEAKDRGKAQQCCICEKSYETEDMAMCPAYRGPICSLCCSLDARCHDACKPGAAMAEQFAALMRRLLPSQVSLRLETRLGHYLLLMLLSAAVLGATMWLIYHEESTVQLAETPALVPILRATLLKIFGVLFVAGGIGCWWLVLTSESRRIAQEESNRQTHLLMREIEAHLKTDAELQNAKLVADRANQAKSRYITGVSHELRTPLNSILGYAQILEYDLSIPPHRRDALSVIRRSGEHLVSLIDGLLDIAKIESGKLTLDTAELRFPEFVTQIAGMFRMQARGKGIEFHYEEQGKVPAVVRADKKRLSQILINILGNAVKFTERGSVNLRLRWRGGTAVFEVQDTGAGIDPHDLERIFLPFERGSASASGAESGTGLGLTIAKMLTNLMGGELSVRSETGVGSVFEIRLFLPEVHAPRMVAALPSLDLSGYAGPRKRVLVVDNEAVDRRFLLNLLQPLGFEVTEAASGIEALQLVPHIQPDLILLDIGMPGINGWETARLLRANFTVHTPILVISADAFEQDYDQGVGIQARDFIVKPVSVPLLLARIRDKLDLVWIARGNSVDLPPVAEQQPGEVVAMPPLPAVHLQELRDLGALGHVRGILDKLDEIDRLDARFSQFTARLRSNIKAFQLSEYMREIEAGVR
jgi:signal transduction histidine kinase/CheY-like chemotaxis protein/purine-cytosine permease-like protein